MMSTVNINWPSTISQKWKCCDVNCRHPIDVSCCHQIDVGHWHLFDYTAWCQFDVAKLDVCTWNIYKEAHLFMHFYPWWISALVELTTRCSIQYIYIIITNLPANYANWKSNIKNKCGWMSTSAINYNSMFMPNAKANINQYD